MPAPFARARAIMRLIQAAVETGNSNLLGINTDYYSRGKGEGCPGNKHAKSSFKQNKRRGF